MDRSAVPVSLEPGLHTEVVDDPDARASAVAADLDADLCATPQEVSALLAQRESFPRLPNDALEDLRRLARRVAAAQRVVEHTVERAAVGVGERLAEGGSGVAVHPSAVHGRAEAVLAARDALAAAQERLREAEAASVRAPIPPPPGAPSASIPPPPGAADPAGAGPAGHDVPAADDAAVDGPAEQPARGRWRWLPIGRRRRDRRADEADTSESTSLLQQVAASAEEAFGARRAGAVRDDGLILLRAQRDRSQEDLRVAERAWRDLAGDDPVEDVHAVVRRFDPQHQVAVEVALDTVEVRAVSGLLESALAAWEAGWRAAGLEPPETVDQAEVEHMVEQLARPVVLVSSATSHAELVTLAVPAAPVIVIAGPDGAIS